MVVDYFAVKCHSRFMRVLSFCVTFIDQKSQKITLDWKICPCHCDVYKLPWKPCVCSYTQMVKEYFVEVVDNVLNQKGHS